MLSGRNYSYGDEGILTLEKAVAHFIFPLSLNKTKFVLGRDLQLGDNEVDKPVVVCRPERDMAKALKLLVVGDCGADNITRPSGLLLGTGKVSGAYQHRDRDLVDAVERDEWHFSFAFHPVGSELLESAGVGILPPVDL